MASKQLIPLAYRDSPLPQYDDEWRDFHDNARDTPKSRKRLPRPALLISLLVNVSLIVFVVLSNGSSPWPAAHRSDRSAISQHDHGGSTAVTIFAGLARNISRKWTYNQASSEEEWVETWKSPDPDPGIVSLSDSYARAKGLPRAQRWPWDPERGIYILNGYHNLHCLIVIKDSIEDHRHKREQRFPWPHVQHCLLALRNEILCDADDTPRYTSFSHRGLSAAGQPRMCRDWTQLEDWARQPEQDGCWKNLRTEKEDLRVDGPGNLDWFRFCGDKNSYKETAKTAWKEQDVQEQQARRGT